MEGQSGDETRQVMARNAEIVESRARQSNDDRLAALEADQRREMLLASMDYDPQGTWEKLTAEQRREKDFVVKALAAGDIFQFPWCQNEEYKDSRDEDFPEELLDDRDAVLAYMSREAFLWNFRGHVFPVPESLRDDREAMLQVVRRNPMALRLASPRLQDDQEIVFTALRQEHEYNRAQQFEFASPRLRGDKDFVLGEIIHCVRRESNLEWLKFHELSIKDERELVLTILEKEGDAGCIMFVFLPHCSPTLRDDKEVMLQIIKKSPETLKYCSDRLKACDEIVQAAVSKDPGALRYALGKYKEEFANRDKATVLKGLDRYSGYDDEIPAHLKSDPEVLLEAVRNGNMAYKDLPLDLRQKKDFVLAAVECDPENDFFQHVPAELQQDEDLCIQILKEEYYSVGSIFERVPSLYQSKEAIMATMDTFQAEIPSGRYKVIEKSPFRDDAEFMLLACESECDCMELVSKRLLSDRDFILTYLSRTKDSACILYTPDEFVLNNMDIVVKAVPCLGENHCHPDDMFTGEGQLPRGVWDHKPFVLACIKRGWLVLDKLAPGSPLLDDSELVRLAVENSPLELQFASSNLRGNREFIMSLVSVNGRTLRYAERWLWNDDDILVVAVANNAGTITDCFGSGSTDAFEHLVSFGSRVRSRLEFYDTFVREFLRGISVVTPHQPPALRCHLPLLDRGIETTVVFKKLIAGYAGVPIGAELHRLRQASMNLRKFGY